MFKKILLLSLCSIWSYCYGDNVVINNHTFPKGFKLGTATAAFQIEGAWNESGKGEHLWDWYMHTYPGKISDGSNGDIACDSYHKWREDIQLLKDLGVDHYRMSIMWTRILPDGIVSDYSINQAGIDYYRNVFQALKEANITPLVTLYHWDLPIHFHEIGGWMNPAIADYFAEYSRICFKYFGDLVQEWITINEPASTCVYGYTAGYLAPGYTLPDGVYGCAYTTLLAHAKAYRIYEKEFKATQGGRVSIVIETEYDKPLTNSTEDLEAAKREMAFFFDIYAHPIYIGNWPQIVIDIVDERSRLQGLSTSRLPKFTDEELELIKGSSDYFALNSYAVNFVQHQHNVNESLDEIGYFADKGTNATFDQSPGILPWGFRQILNYVHNKYNKPEIVITENGFRTTVGDLNDTDRTAFLKDNLSSLLDARLTDGINITGYTFWSLMDNLEWVTGYTIKFGLVNVDFNAVNRTRTPRNSYKWYQNVISTRCLLDDTSKCVPS